MSIPASPGEEVCLEAAPQVDITPLIEYFLGRNGFPWRVGSPRQLLWGPNRGWHADAARILGVSMAEPEKVILIILAHTLPPQMGVMPLGSCARR